jgi:hypothetical protein
MIDNAPQAPEKGYKPDCKPLPAAPKVPEIPKSGTCPERCVCPDPPGGEPQHCFDKLIQEQNIIVKKAQRASAFADELTAIQDKVTSAQADYTQARFIDLRKRWKEQDDAIVELIRKLVCAVDCWDCLLECRLCRQLVEIRGLEDRLNGPPGDDVTGTAPLTQDVHSLFDQQAWHLRNVAQMEARMKRITEVLAAWEKPSGTLGETLDKNDALIKETQNVIASDPGKAVYDVFMTLIPRHWAIRPRGPGLKPEWESGIEEKYVRICDCPQTPEPKPQEANEGRAAEQDRQSCDGEERCLCEDGMPDDCCGPDVGILSLRQRLIGLLPYIVDPAIFSAVICCLTTNRLSPASDQLAEAQANLAASNAEIELVQKQIVDKKAAIEANFRAALANPINCDQYPKKKPPAAPPGGGYPGGPKQPGQNLS